MMAGEDHIPSKIYFDMNRPAPQPPAYYPGPPGYYYGPSYYYGPPYYGPSFQFQFGGPGYYHHHW
jgi:hypothetical protein